MARAIGFRLAFVAIGAITLTAFTGVMLAVVLAGACAVVATAAILLAALLVWELAALADEHPWRAVACVVAAMIVLQFA